MKAGAGSISGIRVVVLLILLLHLPGLAAAPPLSSDEHFARGWQAFEAGDYHRALLIWLPLAEQGDMHAQSNLGFLYEYGQGVGRDEAQAVHWYRQSAGNGLAVAQFNLGMMHAEGRGTRQDPLRAAYWLQQAAEQGLADAQYLLAEHLEQHMDVPRSSATVQDWLTRAAEQGHHEAQAALSAEAGISSVISDASAPGQKATWRRPASFSAGTGWPVDGGYVVTNNHVVAGVEQVVLIDSTGKELTASVVRRDTGHDLALLRVSEPDSLPPALPLAGSDPRWGSRVFTIGYPRIDTMGRTPKLSDGIISALSGYQDDPDSYQTSVPIQPGNSGGPLLNMNGEVVGVVAAMLGARGEGGEPQVLPNVSYAVKAGVLRSMLSPESESATTPEQRTVSSGSLADLAARVQDSVLIVMVAGQQNPP
jgi:S1-C subfamily serine protease